MITIWTICDFLRGFLTCNSTQNVQFYKSICAALKTFLRMQLKKMQTFGMKTKVIKGVDAVPVYLFSLSKPNKYS